MDKYQATPPIENWREVSFKNTRKLCILNVEESETDDNIRSLCEEYGNLLDFNRVPEKRLAFVLYTTEW